jgi:multidrug efflux pump subunit AcrB
MDDVRNALSTVRGNLPVEVKDPVISKLESSGLPFLVYTLASDKVDKGGLSWLVDNEIIKTLMSLPGLGKLVRVGGINREIRVELDTGGMAVLNVSADEISKQLWQVPRNASGGRHCKNSSLRILI